MLASGILVNVGFGQNCLPQDENRANDRENCEDSENAKTIKMSNHIFKGYAPAADPIRGGVLGVLWAVLGPGRLGRQFGL